MSPNSSRSFAYVSNADSHDISVLSLDVATGAVVEIERVPAGSKVMPLVVSHDRRFLYASLRDEPPEVATFAIDPLEGRLAPRGRSPLPASMAFIGLDRSGRHLLSASYGGSQVAVSPIEVGGLAAASRQVLPTAKNAHSIQCDPANAFAFAPCLGGDVVLGYRFDGATGMLAPRDEPAYRCRPGAGPRHFAFHPNRRFVYLLHELDATLDVLAYDAVGGTLSHRQTLGTLPDGFAGGAPWAAEVRFTPDGRFLYTSERRSSTLHAFAVDAISGLASSLGTVPTETEPRGFAIDPSGRWLLAPGQASHRLRVHAIDAATGTLSDHSDCLLGRNPNWVEIVTFG